MWYLSRGCGGICGADPQQGSHLWEPDNQTACSLARDPPPAADAEPAERCARTRTALAADRSSAAARQPVRRRRGPGRVTVRRSSSLKRAATSLLAVAHQTRDVTKNPGAGGGLQQLQTAGCVPQRPPATDAEELQFALEPQGRATCAKPRGDRGCTGATTQAKVRPLELSNLVWAGVRLLHLVKGEPALVLAMAQHREARSIASSRSLRRPFADSALAGVTIRVADFGSGKGLPDLCAARLAAAPRRRPRVTGLERTGMVSSATRGGRQRAARPARRAICLSSPPIIDIDGGSARLRHRDRPSLHLGVGGAQIPPSLALLSPRAAPARRSCPLLLRVYAQTRHPPGPGGRDGHRLHCARCCWRARATRTQVFEFSRWAHEQEQDDPGGEGPRGCGRGLGGAAAELLAQLPRSIASTGCGSSGWSSCWGRLIGVVSYGGRPLSGPRDVSCRCFGGLAGVSRSPALGQSL